MSVKYCPECDGDPVEFIEDKEFGDLKCPIDDHQTIWTERSGYVIVPTSYLECEHCHGDLCINITDQGFACSGCGNLYGDTPFEHIYVALRDRMRFDVAVRDENAYDTWRLNFPEAVAVLAPACPELSIEIPTD